MAVQVELERCRHLRFVDCNPQVIELEQVTARNECSCDLAQRDAELFCQLERQRQATAIDQRIGELGCDQLAPQAVAVDSALIALGHLPRKRRVQVSDQQRIVDDVALDQLVVYRHLGIGHDHRELGPLEPLPGAAALHQRVVAGQSLDAAVEPRRARLERLDQSDMARQGRRAATLGDRKRLRLQSVVCEHQLGDGIGHRDQQRVAIGLGQATGGDLRAERDLDVDLVVRAVDAPGVVDEIGVDPAAMLGELDPRRLRDAKVRALADDARAELVRGDAVGVVGAVTDLGVAFVAGANIGADAAEPQQIDLRLEHRDDQLGR